MKMVGFIPIEVGVKLWWNGNAYNAGNI
jgi:hypothetical protein